jgi:hypothetical protein
MASSRVPPFYHQSRHVPMTMGEAMAKTDMDPYVCEHCIERGPNLTTADMEAEGQAGPPSSHPLLKVGRRKPSPPILPSKQEIDVLIQETLAKDYRHPGSALCRSPGIPGRIHGSAVFLPGNWLSFYQAYRATGDKRILESLRVSARHYRDLCNEYPDVAQLKARDPEAWPLCTMAVSARSRCSWHGKTQIRLAQDEIAEAETSSRPWWPP